MHRPWVSRGEHCFDKPISHANSIRLFSHTTNPKPFYMYEHTFSAFWLCSSVIPVRISVTADMSPTEDLHVTMIFLRADVILSLLKCSGMLPWPGTLPGAAHPLWVNECWKLPANLTFMPTPPACCCVLLESALLPFWLTIPPPKTTEGSIHSSMQ